MANRIKIRHGSGTPDKDGQLLPYELGWNGTSLYINNNGTVEKVGKEYLPLTGGTVTGDITIQGGTSTNSRRINLNRYDGSVTGFVGYSRDSSKYGLYITGTGTVNGYLALMDTTNGRVYYRDSYSNNQVSLAYSQSGLTTTSWFAAWSGYELRAISPQNSANIGLDALSAGTSDPVDGDTYIASYADGKNVAHNGTNTYHRRPVASLYNYIKGKASGSWAISITGNASTASTASAVARATFGDSANGTHDANSMTSNGLYYYNSNGPASIGNSASDGAIYVQAYNTNWVSQIAQDYRNGNLFVRGKNNGTWQAWKGIVSSNLSRRIYVATSASVPSGAVAGDIVLVKV